MLDHPVLGQVALGFSPLIDRQRAVVATRLTVFPARPDAAIDAPALLAALLEVWPADAAPGGAAAPAASGSGTGPGITAPVSLNLAGEALLDAVLKSAPHPQLMVEVPAFMATDAAQAERLQALKSQGARLVIKGRPLAAMAPELLACFSHAIVDAQDDRRDSATPAPGVRQVSTVQAGVRTAAAADLAFSRGAVAVLGWPFDDPLAPPGPEGTRGKIATDVQVVMELIQGVDREEPVGRLEAVLKRDPTLAFRLLRYLNSPAFGLNAEVTSFGHAILMLGYGRLKRWLSLLLASSGKGVNAKPLMFAAVRRGLLMEELGRTQGDAEMRGEMFICGVFSMLDRLLQHPMSDLLKNVPVPERVRQTLLATAPGGGTYGPYLQLARAAEGESVFDVREATERLLLSPADVNRALLSALRQGRQLEG